MFRPSTETALHVPRPAIHAGQSETGKRIEIGIYEAANWSKISPTWSRLEFLSPYTSFYLSEDWISAWLETFGATLRPKILVFEEEKLPIAACLLTSAVEKRGPFRVARMVLNTGAEPLRERTLTEFNNTVCCPGKGRCIP